MQVKSFDISKIEGYPFSVTDEARDDYPDSTIHPLIDPYFESSRIVKYFYWKKIHMVMELGDYDPRSTVLDMGCGPGIFLPTLSANFNKVIALDINDSDLRIAASICRSLGLENVEITHSDIAHLQLGDNAIDIAFSLDALEHIKDLEAAFDKLNAAIREGGYLVFSAPTENLFNDISRRSLGFEKPKSHYYGSRDIARLAAKSFRLVKRITPFRMPWSLSVVEMYLFQK